MMSLGFEIPAVALRKSRAAPVGPFSPLQLSPSAMFDPADTTKLFQDSAGTSPVTGDNQPVGLWQDESPNGLDLSQPISAARPSYRTDGSFQWIETDGVDDSMISASVLRLGNPLTMVLGCQLLSTVGTKRVNFAEISKSSKNAISVGARAIDGRLQVLSWLDDQNVSASHVGANANQDSHTKNILTCQATSGNTVVRLNGVEVLNTSQALNGEFLDNQPLRVGIGKAWYGEPGAFRLFGLQVWNAASMQPSLAQIEQLEGWMANRIGVTL